MLHVLGHWGSKMKQSRQEWHDKLQGPTRRKFAELAASILVASSMLCVGAQAQPKKELPPLGEETDDEKRWNRIKGSIIEGVNRADRLKKKRKKDGEQFAGTDYIRMLDTAIDDAWWWVDRYLALLSAAERKKICKELEKFYRNSAVDSQKEADKATNPAEKAAWSDLANADNANADRFASLGK